MGTLCIVGGPATTSFLQATATFMAHGYMKNSGRPAISNHSHQARKSACRHEAGRTLITVATGLDVSDVRVWESKQGWTGFTFAPEPATTADSHMVPQVCRLLAGVIAESTDMETYIPGSSADEIGTAHALCAAIGINTESDPSTLIRSCVSAVRDYLASHERVLSTLASALFDAGLLDGSQLVPMLDGISPLQLPKVIKAVEIA